MVFDGFLVISRCEMTRLVKFVKMLVIVPFCRWIADALLSVIEDIIKS